MSAHYPTDKGVAARVEELSAGTDRTGEVDSAALQASTARFTSDPAALREAGVIIVAVPTPIDEHRNPDLSPVEGLPGLWGGICPVARSSCTSPRSIRA